MVVGVVGAVVVGVELFGVIVEPDFVADGAEIFGSSVCVVVVADATFVGRWL
jgi:hypothetical protein